MRRVTCSSFQVLKDEVQEFAAHYLGSTPTNLFCLSRTVGEMIPHHLATDAAQCLLDGSNLDEYIGAVAPLLHHPLDPADLSLYAP